MDLPKAEFVGTCVELRAGNLHAYDDSSRKITWRTFLKKVGGRRASAILSRRVFPVYNDCPGLSLASDYAVQFSKGLWRGKPAVCIHHSAIHYIWKLK